jgi:hypothetical protein
MESTPKITLLRVLHAVFLGLMVAGIALLTLNQGNSLGITDGQPSIQGWVTAVGDHQKVTLPNPEGSSALNIYNFNQRQFLTIEFASRSDLLEPRYLGYILFQNLAWLFGILVLYQMFRIFRNLDRGLTFQTENIRRVRYIAFMIPAIPLAAFLASRILAGIVRALPGYQSPGVRPADSVEDIVFSILVAILIFAVVEIFQRGAHLQQEQDLTV